MLGTMPLSQVSIWVNVTRIEEHLIPNNMVHPRDKVGDLESDSAIQLSITQFYYCEILVTGYQSLASHYASWCLTELQPKLSEAKEINLVQCEKPSVMFPFFLST